MCWGVLGVSRVYFVSETAQVEREVDECKPLAVIIRIVNDRPRRQ